jgi:hypothetical protein
MAFCDDNGLPNELLAEQFLQNELGYKIEQKPEGSKHLNISRLNEIFKPILIKQSIDTRWTNEKQATAFFTSDTEFIAITENSKFNTLASKTKLINEVLKGFFSN